MALKRVLDGTCRRDLGVVRFWRMGRTTNCMTRREAAMTSRTCNEGG